MAPFDIYVKEIAKYIEGIRSKKRRFREMNCPEGSANLIEGLPVLVGRGAQPGVILKEDMCVELGNPRMASCAFLLWTDNLSLVRDGRITLIGPDIPESMGKSLPFGQVLLISGTDLKEEHHAMLEWGQYVSDRIEGYMIRSVPRRMWSRISKKVVEKGFCFETLGRALMWIIKSELPMVEAVEILFITSNKEDVEELESIAKQVEKIAGDIKKGKFIIGDDGTYVCTNGLDCNVCLDKNVCDSIREMVAIRKANIRSA